MSGHIPRKRFGQNFLNSPGVIRKIVAGHAADPTLTRLRVNVLAVNRIACRSYEKAGFTPYEVMYERLIRPAKQ